MHSLNIINKAKPIKTAPAITIISDAAVSKWNACVNNQNSATSKSGNATM